jgi:hypothetical protein
MRGSGYGYRVLGEKPEIKRSLGRPGHRNLRARDHLEDLGVEGTIILK